MSARYTGGLVYNAPGGWSGLFNGTTQYLRVSANTAIDVGSGDFTINVWSLPFTKTNGVDNIFGYGSFTMMLYHNNTSWTLEMSNNGSSNQVAITAPVTLNVWQYLTIVKSGTTVTLYKNAVSQSTGTISGSVNTSGKNLDIGANGLGNGQWFTGYISNYQLIKGTAVVPTLPSGSLKAVSGTTLLTCCYSTFVDGSVSALSITNNGGTLVSAVNPFPTSQLPNPALGGAGNGVYTMSQYAALKAANLWPAFDPFYKNVTLNLHGNGTNAAQNNTFLDSANNYTITRNGNTTQGTFSPFGPNWSNFFNGSSGVTVSSTSSQFSFSGDFTWEAWVNLSALPSSGNSVSIICSRGSVASNSAFQFFITNSSGTYRVGSTISISSTDYGPTWDIPSAPSLGVWYHVAVVRSGSSVQAYWNGSAIGSAQTASGTTNTPTVNPSIGFRGGSYNDLFLNGYISNLRMAGSAVYTSNFTPSTTPLTAISGTRILTCADNRFFDDSTNGFTLTAYSSPSVQRFSPFSPTPDYSTAVFGGGAYFDGTGDSLTLANNAAFNIGANDFCMEMWAYGPSGMFFWAAHQGGVANGFYFETGGGLSVFPGYNSLIPFPSWTNGQWIHAVCTRASGRFRLFQNGVLVATTTTNPNVNMDGHLLGISGGDNFVGGVGQFGGGRYINGSVPTAYQTASTTLNTQIFTPPTSPFTTTSQGATSADVKVLVNFTNAGILDNAMMNNLETVGNAQISTSVVKYGTGSMAFDGTGDWLACPPEPVQFGTGSFTIEAWVYPTASRYNPIITRNWVGNNKLILAITSSGAVDVWVGHATSGYYQGTSSAVCSTLNTWYHIALVRNGSTITCYVNGSYVLTGSCTATMTDSNTNLMYIGYYLGDGSTFQGYIDDFRITKGVARYTANFTPPTSQVQDQ